MVDLPETPTWTGVVRLETTTPVRGGATGESNAPLSDLVDRTAYLKVHVDAIEAALPLLAPIASPDFTGTPQSVTPPAGDSSRKIVTTEWVWTVLRGVTTKAVTGGVVNLTATEAGRGIIVLTGDLTSAVTVTVPTGQPGRWVVANRTNGAFAVGIRNNGSVLAPLNILPGGSIAAWSDGTDLRAADTESTDHTLRGAPTASSPPATSNDQRVPTTAWARAFARGATSLTATGGATITLTDAQANAPTIIISGSPNAAFTIVFPAEPGRWTVRNTTGQRADLKTSGQGSPLALAASRTQSVWADGSVIRPDATEARDMDLPGATTGDTPAWNAAGREVVTAEWVRALLSGQTISTTGDIKLALKATPDAGWLALDGSSIGDALSGATGRAHADAEALFLHLWSTFDNATCPVSGGRGASAAADFAAHKRITLPDARGRALVMAGLGPGLTSRALGSVFGAEAVAITLAQMPAHAHTGNTGQAGSHQHDVAVNPDPGHSHTAATDSRGNHSHGAALSSAGEHQHALVTSAVTFTNAPFEIRPEEGTLHGGSGKTSSGTTPAGSHSHGITLDAAGEHAHTVNVASGGAHTHAAVSDQAPHHTHSIAPEGNSDAHANMQPSFAVNLFVKL